MNFYRNCLGNGYADLKKLQKNITDQLPQKFLQSRTKKCPKENSKNMLKQFWNEFPKKLLAGNYRSIFQRLCQRNSQRNRVGETINGISEGIAERIVNVLPKIVLNESQKKKHQRFIKENFQKNN